jgi:hypothetical protein
MTTTTAPPAAESYRELGLLAEGGMALVIQAVRDRDGKDVVIKRIRPPLCFDASFVRLFLDEGVLHATFDHDHIVQLVDRGEDAQGPYLVFEHVSGIDLSILLEQARATGVALDVELVLAIARPLLSALSCVHGACRDGVCLDVVHRDISPGNVLLGEDGGVKLADFGVAASRLKTDQTVAGELKGKFSYMAPEQTRGERVGPAADLFAVGVILWECLANRRLFDAPTDADIVQQVRHREVERLDHVDVAGPRIDTALADFVAALLERDPATRPTASAALATINQLIDERGLDGLSRLVARAVRQAPRRDVTAIAPDVRRHTQRVTGLAGADTILRRPAPRRRPGLVIGFVAVSVAMAGLAISQVTPPAEVVTPLPPTPGPAPASVVVAVAPTPAPLPAAAVVSAPPPAPPAQPKPPAAKPKPAQAPTAPAPIPEAGVGRLSISSEPWGRVVVDGVVVAAETPLVGFMVQSGKHQVVVENPVLGLRKALTIDIAKDGHERRFIDLANP